MNTLEEKEAENTVKRMEIPFTLLNVDFPPKGNRILHYIIATIVVIFYFAIGREYAIVLGVLWGLGILINDFLKISPRKPRLNFTCPYCSKSYQKYADYVEEESAIDNGFIDHCCSKFGKITRLILDQDVINKFKIKNKIKIEG